MEDRDKLIETIVSVLRYELQSVYCDSCQCELDDDLCGDCHRKYMNWGISEEYARNLAKKIVSN